MTAYTVHEPLGAIGDPLTRADRIALVKEGFAWPALWFQALWLIYHRMWWVLLGFVALAAALAFGLAAADAGAAAAGLAWIALIVMFAVHANDLLRWTLARRGYSLVAAVGGRSRAECERAFFSQWVAKAEAAPGSPMAAESGARAATRRRRGLFAKRAQIVIVDYGSGNLHSAGKAFERAARAAGGGLRVAVSSDPEDVLRAERIVLPGVGTFADCLHGLQAVDGMLPAIEEAVRRKGKPFLGICVGMQLTAGRGLEHGETSGLGWIAGEVRAIEPADPALKIPHMGWNTLDVRRPHPLLAGIPVGADGLHAYFVHSYHLVPEDRADVVAETGYGGPVTAMVARDNIAGTQFHPEKSQRLGLALIANFLKWTP